MAQERFTQDGVVYETLPNGNVRVVGYAEAPTQGQVFTLPQDPMETAKDQASLARTRQELATTAATAPYDARRAAADAAKAEADAEKARRDLAAQQSTATPEQQRGMADLANDEILSAIQRARGDLRRSGSAGMWARLPEFAQPQSAIDLGGSLNTIASRLTLDKLAQLKQASPTGASGLGSLTEKEGALLRDSVAALGQTQSPDRLEENLASVERHYRNLLALSRGEDYRDPKVAERYGIAALPNGPQDQPNALAQGAYRDEPDPALRGVNNRIRSMIGSGASANDIVNFMNSVVPGLGNQRAADVLAAVKFRAQNPKVPLDRYTISVENRQVPMSDTRQMVNTIAQTPGGTYFANAADALSAGTIDNLQKNPALARAGMAAISSENKLPALLGTLSGGALASGLGEGAVGGLGARIAPRAADILYGGAYGAGSADEGDRVTGALKGAFAGAVGGELGRRGASAVGSAVRGVQNEAAQILRERGIPLTPGQILGGARKAKEDRLAGFGGVGDRIINQRRAGMEAFNRAAYREGLQPIGEQAFNQVGEEAVDNASDLVSAAYRRALNGVRLEADRPFVTDVRSALTAGRAIPRTGPEFEHVVNSRIAPLFDAGNGSITGRQFQDALQGIRSADFGTDAMGSEASSALGDVEGALNGLIERQAPEALGQYRGANAAYRNHSILADATAAAMNTGGVFTPAQLGQAARANAKKFTGRISAARTDRPFYELQRAGQEVLPSRIPDSGTAGRSDAGAEGITALARKAVRNAKGAVIYNDMLQEPITRALLDRSPGMVAAGNTIANNARRFGLFGRPLALNYGPLAVSDY